MTYSEKLEYLFRLTHAEGKELAAAMNITPPQISKMRRGLRGLPKSPEAARILASFFAQRCGSDHQRNDLAATIKLEQIRTITNVEELGEILLDWLGDDRRPDEYAAKQADSFLRQFGLLYDSNAASRSEGARQDPAAQSRFFAYYGGEGKRTATLAFLDYIYKRKEPDTINILSDESMEWILEEPNFSKQLQDAMLRVTEVGCRFCRIAGPISDMDQAFESLRRWLPLYMTDKATSYYYKRLRDNLNRITMIVVPDIAVLFSFSVGGRLQRDSVTFFSLNKRTANAMDVEFHNYLAHCEPIMNVYSLADSIKRLNDCMLTYESYEGNCIQYCNSLSYITLPWDVVKTYQFSGGPEAHEVYLNSFAQRAKRFAENIKTNVFIDIIHLYDIDTVFEGRAMLPTAILLCEAPQFYTPATYLQHLQGIVYRLEHSKHYHVVLRDIAAKDDTIIYVKEGHCALLMRDVLPFRVFEVSEHHLVDAFTEHLRRFTPGREKAAQSKHAAVVVLKNQIAEIEARLAGFHT